MSLAERQKEFCGYFVAMGYPAKSAASIGGNATRENNCLPTTAGAKDHGSDGSLQWRGPRLLEVQGMLGWDTLKVQAAFTIRELQRDYKALEADLRAGTKSLASLTLDFCDVFERPREAGRVPDIRIKAATDCLALITGVAPAAPAVLSTITPKQGALQMPPFDPVLAAQLVNLLAPLVESLVAGLIKGVVTQIATHPDTN